MDSNNDPDVLRGIEMGLGAWAWGDRVIWQYGRGYTDSDIQQAFQASVKEGIRLVDTAEVYGSGRSERLLGRFVRESTEPILVATKFFPWPWRLGRGSIVSALRGSLQRLGLDRVALYQIHVPTPLRSPETMMEAMVRCVEAGLTRAVGVSNFSQPDMLRAYATLARHDVHLVSNQVHYSLLDRRIEKDGLLARCHELGIHLIAYSPLEMGLLTGKYSPSKPPPASRTFRYMNLLGRIGPLLKLMTKIGQDHAGRSCAQVALNWVLAKGALPIPGAKNQAQALANAGALGWKLSAEEVANLDAATDALD